MPRSTFWPALWFAVVLLTASAGVSAQQAGAPPNRFDGVYSGKIVLTKGAVSVECPAEDNVSLTIHGDTVTFIDRESEKFTQPFDPDQDGSFGETSNVEGGITVHYHGRIVGDVLDADVSNPPCEYHWHLKKK
jgi:hypothetical protein